ncbi:DUF6265 family protein [Sabulilitoribacter multivorans]|uniref:DUF6265 family protein n=1 Tax=Flaviramulus multivorans TaxID=1304750 RepID=A0ABS9IIE8_9FLAO|nr:DUF6265 family protein [Flaviramulus multivorans]MCF7560531.1 DUF6265 family protein [Flaviramulus multivorans]
MKTINLFICLLILATNSGCSQNASLHEVEFLIGTWKIENKESYESWEKKDDKLVGHSYKLKNGEKVISEDIDIKIIENQIIYTPTVFNQNQGKGIPFKLKTFENNLFSFENPEHDFPKKVQYKVLSDSELYVSVLGENDKGFSYKLIKQIN